ncbi:MAG: amino acid permease [Spirochaetales bacterium]|nr:amino acid permease [Spirochaetales bacterium]
MKLKKEISFPGVFSIATGAMISSGIFILPGLAYAKTGPAVFISYFLAGILALIGILSVIELSTAMPKAGGDYYFINRSLGPMIGTISGFLGWFALSLKSAFALFGISEIIFLLTGCNHIITSGVLCLVFIVLNILGIKEATIFQVIMVSVLLLLIIIYVAFGIPKMNFSFFSPFLNGGLNTIVITAGFIFISFGGLLKVASISEEVKNPKRNLPLGMIMSIIVVTVLYTVIVFAMTGIMEPQLFKNSLTPVSDSAKLIMGFPGYVIITIASILAFITTANAGIMSASRYPLALSRDNLLPEVISRVNKRSNSPVIAVIITGILIFLSLLLPLEILVKTASTVILTSYVLTNISVIILRESKISNYKPSFKAPLYPWLQIFSIILFTFFIFELGAEAVEISLGFLIVCFCFYFFYGRKKNKGEYALLYLLKRITDKRLSENLLEHELREIIITRDQIEQDSFDNLVRKAKILDLEGPMDFRELFSIVARVISKEINLTREDIINRFIQRQEESNTAISDFLAIPHIVVDGENTMFLIIVRCKEGIKFTEQENNIKAVFLFGGTGEKRVLHLKTLASIATLVQQKDFIKSWLKVENKNELRDFILLSRRMRFQ